MCLGIALRAGKYIRTSRPILFNTLQAALASLIRPLFFVFHNPSVLSQDLPPGPRKKLTGGVTPDDCSSALFLTRSRNSSTKVLMLLLLATLPLFGKKQTLFFQPLLVNGLAFIRGFFPLYTHAF